MFLNPLFKHRYQADLEAPPPPPRAIHPLLSLYTATGPHGHFIGRSAQRLLISNRKSYDYSTGIKSIKVKTKNKKQKKQTDDTKVKIDQNGNKTVH